MNVTPLDFLRSHQNSWAEIIRLTMTTFLTETLFYPSCLDDALNAVTGTESLRDNNTARAALISTLDAVRTAYNEMKLLRHQPGQTFIAELAGIRTAILGYLHPAPANPKTSTSNL